HHKGRSTEERIKCRFGCANPEGYRKALLKMKLAEKFHVPIVTLIDTPGAYPGLDSEQRGQAEAIAVNLREMSRLRTPIVCIVIGEGGSGGALGIGVGDRIAMLQHSWYSVISPEGCAAILWKKANEQTNNSAAQALALTAECNLKNGLIDAIIPEPNGGAHRDPQATAERLQGWVVDSIRELQRLSPRRSRAARRARRSRLGAASHAHDRERPGPDGRDHEPRRRHGQLRAGGELRTGYDLRTAKRSLSLLLMDWANRGINLWTLEQGTHVLSSGVGTYDLPVDTVDLLDHVIRTGTGTNQIDINISRISSSTYVSIPNKNSTGRPIQIWINRRTGATGADNVVVYPQFTVWPLPDNSTTYTLYYTRLRRMYDVGNGVNGQDVPFRFLPCMVAGLAYYL
ncbi:MAG: hypothetical protein EBW68_10340, partial [Actinobacteria bacterium]|nr:hypothetical protein [Actinomycetota bacterium]